VFSILWIGYFGWNEYASYFHDWFAAPVVPADDDCSNRLGKWPSGKVFDVYDFVANELSPNDPPDTLPLISDQEGRLTLESIQKERVLLGHLIGIGGEKQFGKKYWTVRLPTRLLPLSCSG
jgi:hypothetical protein